MAVDEEQAVPIAPDFGQLELPLYVINGFANGASFTEAVTTLIFNQRPAAQIVMSFPVAKSLAKALQELVDKYEKSSGTTVLGVEELASRIQASMKAQAPGKN